MRDGSGRKTSVLRYAPAEANQWFKTLSARPLGFIDTDDKPSCPDSALPPNQILDLLSRRRRADRVPATLDEEELFSQNE